MLWITGPERWRRLVEMTSRLEHLIDACARVDTCDARELRTLMQQFARMHARLTWEVETEHVRLLQAPSGDPFTASDRAP